MKYNPRDENSIKAVMAKANVVINLIGKYLTCSIFELFSA
jgi:saccharopine dehydrogenase-like NADP-dependent oxidoreductase